MLETISRKNLTEQLAYFLGFYLGDGYFSSPVNGRNRRHITVQKMDKDRIDHLARIGISYSHYPSRSIVKSKTSSTLFYRCKFQGKRSYFLNLVSSFVGEGLPKRFPDLSWWTLDQKLAIAAGLLDSDGYVSSGWDKRKQDYNHSIGFCNTNLDMFDKVKGIFSESGAKLRKTQKEYPRMNAYGKKPVFSIRMSLESFMESKLYFLSARKNNRLGIAIKDRLSGLGFLRDYNGRLPKWSMV